MQTDDEKSVIRSKVGVITGTIAKRIGRNERTSCHCSALWLCLVDSIPKQ